MLLRRGARDRDVDCSWGGFECGGGRYIYRYVEMKFRINY